MIGSFISCYFFFFKQKTAYEMRISDWSSDVCSSDLTASYQRESRQRRKAGSGPAPWPQHQHAAGDRRRGQRRRRRHRLGRQYRSEEHTSELQSLMRISYAVFCLKKKTHVINPVTNAQFVYSILLNKQLQHISNSTK